VHEIFFQVFDKAAMEDGEGRRVDFSNTLIILTTNVGTDLIAGLCKDSQLMPDPQSVAEALRAPLLKVFPAALLGRLIVIPYFPLSDSMLGEIIRLQMDRVVARMKQNHSVQLHYDAEVIELIASRCKEPESGGRMIDAILTNTLLPQISRELLQRICTAVPTASVAVGVKDGEFTCRFQ
jgi:type VI secretion system protein VasG